MIEEYDECATDPETTAWRHENCFLMPGINCWIKNPKTGKIERCL